MDSDSSGSSSVSVECPAGVAVVAPKECRSKLEVYAEVLRRLRDSDLVPTSHPSFEDDLLTHFKSLPSRYALDVNVGRVEEVLNHKRLLEMAKESRNGPVFDVRVVQVHALCEGTSSDFQLQEDQDSSSYFSKMSVHHPPAFGSSPSLEALVLEANEPRIIDGDEIVNENFLVPRITYEITFAADDRPRLLSELTSLLGEIGVNIQEAHVYSTDDGYSLDVVVVESSPHKELEQVRQAIENKILVLEKKPLSRVDHFTMGPILQEEAQIGENFPFNRVQIPEDQADMWDIDIRRLKFEKKVASGSYGELYKGTYCNQDVAIKVLNSDRITTHMQQEFTQELHIMQKVRHKNVVQFIGACTKPPYLCIITEFMVGGSLYDYLHKQKGSFKIPAMVRVAIDISKGMNYLHHNSIIHRDLKTANLLMDENEVVKVADFGVARVKCASGVMTAETGTYRWMAPEVIEHKPYDHKADVFSFAVSLWELLTGKIPYEYLTPLQAAVGVVQNGLRPTIPKNTHPKIVELLETCWQQDPSLRPDFSEILEMLQCISKELKNHSEEHRKERHSSRGFFASLRCG